MSCTSTTTRDRCDGYGSERPGGTSGAAIRDREGDTKNRGQEADLCPACYADFWTWINSPRTLPLEAPDRQPRLLSPGLRAGC
jgi:hypothetical protein